MMTSSSSTRQQQGQGRSPFERLAQIAGHSDFSTLAMLMLARKETGADLACIFKILDAVTIECTAEDPEENLCSVLTMASVCNFAAGRYEPILLEDYPNDSRANRLLTHWGARSTVFLPVHADDVSSVVLLAWKQPRPLNLMHKQFQELQVCFQSLIPQRDLDRQLKVTQDRLSSILETIPQGVVFVDFDTAEAWMNAPARELLDLPSVTTAASSLSLAMQKLREAAHNIQGTHASDHHTPTRGSWIWTFGNPATKVVAVETRRLNVEGRIGQLWVFQDVTADYTQRQELIEQGKALALANEELEAFTASVTHDLRAPLRVLASFADALEEDIASLSQEEAHHYIHSIKGQTSRMYTLIDDLLSFSRLGRQSVSKETVDMNQLVKECLDQLHIQNQAQHVELNIADLPSASGDPSLLKQVWINLLSNAYKYSSKRPIARIRVSAEEKRNETIYVVEDNGVGFSMENAAKLFGTFQRLHQSQQFEGTGMGLAIVQRIVQRHGGRVWAHAVVDQGATFFFALPKE